MSGPPTKEQWRLAEALALKKLHGADTPRFIAERIGALALARDYAGIERLREITRAFEGMVIARRRLH